MENYWHSSSNKYLQLVRGLLITKLNGQVRRRKTLGGFAIIKDVLGAVIYVIIRLPTLNCHMLGIPNENTQSRGQET